jgi:hypothetical protein
MLSWHVRVCGDGCGMCTIPSAGAERILRVRPRRRDEGCRPASTPPPATWRSRGVGVGERAGTGKVCRRHGPSVPRESGSFCPPPSTHVHCPPCAVSAWRFASPPPPAAGLADTASRRDRAAGFTVSQRSSGRGQAHWPGFGPSALRAGSAGLLARAVRLSRTECDITLIPADPRLRSHEPGTRIGSGRVNTMCDHAAGEILRLRPNVAVWQQRRISL